MMQRPNWNAKRQEATEQCGEREPPMARVLKSTSLGGGPVTATVLSLEEM
jgi:hypothetical protein